MAVEKKTVTVCISRKNPAYGTLLTLAAAGFDVEKSIVLVDSDENGLTLYVLISNSSAETFFAINFL